MAAIQVEIVKREIYKQGYELADKLFRRLSEQIAQSRCILYLIIQLIHKEKNRPTHYTVGFALRILLYKAYNTSKQLGTCIHMARKLHLKTDRLRRSPAKYFNLIKSFKPTVAQLQTVTLSLQTIEIQNFVY